MPGDFSRGYLSANSKNDTIENITSPQITYACGNKGLLVDFSSVLHRFQNFTNVSKDNMTIIDNIACLSP